MRAATTAGGLAGAGGFTLVVAMILQWGRNRELTSTNRQGETRLMRAARDGHVSRVNNLLARGAEPNDKDKFGRTPLSWAAMRGHEAVVKLLADRDDVEADSKDQWGRTALSHAVENGHVGVVKLLMEKGADAESKDQWGQTPLSRITESVFGHSAMLALLGAPKRA